MFISVLALYFSSFQTTYSLLAVKTEPVENIFVANPEGTVILTKQVLHPYGTDYQIPNSISFSFKVTLGETYAGKEVSTSSGKLNMDEKGNAVVVLKANESLSIYGLEPNKKVTVKELETSLTGFSIAGESKQSTRAVPDKENELIFINQYQPQQVDTSVVEIAVGKKLEHRKWMDKDCFTYILEYKVNDQWIEIDRQSITAQDKEHRNLFEKALQDVAMNHIGVYDFRIYELKEGLSKEDYDPHIYYFSVITSDTDMDGFVEISDIEGSDQLKVEKLNQSFKLFAQFYSEEKEDVIVPVKQKINIEKILVNKGSKKASLKGFEFVLENMQTHEKTMTYSDENGKSYFQLTFDEKDIKKTFDFKVYETNQGVKGMTYDTKVYNVKVEVSLDKKNMIHAKLIVDGVSSDKLNLKFHNTYEMNQKTPGTGDSHNILFWFAMSIMSFVMLIILLFYDQIKPYFKKLGG